MNKKTGANRGLRCAGALALVAGVAVLSTACGGASHPSSASSGTGDQTHAQAQQGQPQNQQSQQEQQLQKAELATLTKFAHCVQGHGVANWPDPILTSQGISMNLQKAGINPNSPQVQAAMSACQHVAPGLQLHASTVHASTKASAHAS